MILSCRTRIVYHMVPQISSFASSPRCDALRWAFVSVSIRLDSIRLAVFNLVLIGCLGSMFRNGIRIQTVVRTGTAFCFVFIGSFPVSMTGCYEADARRFDLLFLVFTLCAANRKGLSDGSKGTEEERWWSAAESYCGCGGGSSSLCVPT